MYKLIHNSHNLTPRHELQDLSGQDLCGSWGKIEINEKRYNLLLTDMEWSDMIAFVAEGTASYRGDRVR